MWSTQKPVPRLTADGSWTFYLGALDEPYHSVHGALSESKHVFIEQGLKALQGLDSIRILEVGLGSGLNAWLSLIQAGRPPLEYTAFEPFPIEPKEIELWNERNGFEGIELFHRADWDSWNELAPDFRFRKICASAERASEFAPFDLVYHDAFAPEAQAELWTTEFFGSIFESMNRGGIWVSYSAKGSVRRSLIAAGFEVERLPGPPGKREMLRARKP